MLKFLLIFTFGCLVSVGPVFAQGLELDKALFDDTYFSVKESIKERSQRQAMYAYNIANLSTPEFVPVLFPDDRALLLRSLPDAGLSREVLIEFVMARMTDNRSRYAATISIYKKKADIYKQVFTLGKR